MCRKADFELRLSSIAAKAAPTVPFDLAGAALTAIAKVRESDIDAGVALAAIAKVRDSDIDAGAALAAIAKGRESDIDVGAALAAIAKNREGPELRHSA